MLVFAHVSDTHFDGGERARERAERVLAYLNGLPRPLDAVVVTGDIADHGSPDEYREARKVLATPYPLITCPGNHDVRDAYREVLLADDGPGGGDEPVDRVYRAGGAVFAMCDSTIPGRPDGRLADRTLEWLDGVLTDTPHDTPVFVAFHHPPLVLHAPYVDGIRQSGEDRLAAVLARHPHVAAVLCGHAHTAAATTFAGLPLLVAPGVASTIRLAVEEGGDGPVDRDAPPAVAIHVLGDDGRLVTHYRPVVRDSAPAG